MFPTDYTCLVGMLSGIRISVYIHTYIFQFHVRRSLIELLAVLAVL